MPRQTIEQMIRALPPSDRMSLAHQLNEFAIQNMSDGAATVAQRVADVAMEGITTDRFLDWYANRRE